MSLYWAEMYEENEVDDHLMAVLDQVLVNCIRAVMRERFMDAEQAMDFLGFAEKYRPDLRKLLTKAGVSVGASA